MGYFKATTIADRIRFTPRSESKTSDFSLEVSLQRTLRIPDDGKTYPLPPGFGTFPVRKVDDYKDKVPAAWREHGGVFVPLYQREALWLSFQAGGHWRPCAVKVAAGKINAVSGEPWVEKLLDGQPVGGEQDYMVVPPQPWLDGFNTGKGVIRQFVSMPLGMGYTVEGQVTGKEDVGGIQVQVYDPKDGKFAKSSVTRSLNYGDGYKGGGLSFSSLERLEVHDGQAAVDNAPAEMGLAAGGKMTQKIYPDDHGYDTWDGDRGGRIFIHIVNSQMWTQITGEAAPTTPVTARSYAANNYPWFDLYDEGKGDVGASETLKKVKSVAQKDLDHGFSKQMDNTSVEAKNVKKLNVPEVDPNEVVDGTW